MKSLFDNIFNPFVGGVAYIAFWWGMVSTTKTNSCGQEIEWYMQLLIVGVLTIPFILGFLAGRRENS